MSNSSLVSGLSEASGARCSWVEVSQESLKHLNKIRKKRPIEGLLKAFKGAAQLGAALVARLLDRREAGSLSRAALGEARL